MHMRICVYLCECIYTQFVCLFTFMHLYIYECVHTCESQHDCFFAADGVFFRREAYYFSNILTSNSRLRLFPLQEVTTCEAPLQAAGLRNAERDEGSLLEVWTNPDADGGRGGRGRSGAGGV